MGKPWLIDMFKYECLSQSPRIPYASIGFRQTQPLRPQEVMQRVSASFGSSKFSRFVAADYSDRKSDSFFADLQAMLTFGPAVLFFDSFEAVQSETESWIRDELLSRVIDKKLALLRVE